MSVELHLPDLPEVPLSLGPVAVAPQPVRRLPWHLRLRDVLSTYLPLLLMALLALGTWWLVKHTPVRVVPVAPSDVRREPDYEMQQFAIERFDRAGRLRVRVDGERLRHFPDTDRYEVDGARIHAVGADGRLTLARAERALANGDISQVQLLGGAQVTGTSANGLPLDISSEFLQADLVNERVHTHMPVRVTEGSNELRAGALAYDHGRRLLELSGRIRASLVAAKGAAR